MAKASGDQRSDGARHDTTGTATGSAPWTVAAFAATLTVMVAAFGLIGERRAHADVPVGNYFDLTCYDSGSSFTEFAPVVYWDATPNPVAIGATTTEQVRVDIPTLASNSHHLNWRFTIPTDEQFVGTPTITDMGDLPAGNASATIVGSDTLVIEVVGPFDANRTDVDGPTVQFQLRGTDGAGFYSGYHLRAAEDGYAFSYTRTDVIFQIGVNCDVDHWTWIGPFRADAPTTTATTSSTTTAPSTTTTSTTTPATTTPSTTTPATTTPSTTSPATTTPSTSTPAPTTSTSTTAAATTSTSTTSTSTTAAPTATTRPSTTAPSTSPPPTTTGPTSSTTDPVSPSSVASGSTGAPTTSATPAAVDPAGVPQAPVARPVVGTPDYTG